MYIYIYIYSDQQTILGTKIANRLQPKIPTGPKSALSAKVLTFYCQIYTRNRIRSAGTKILNFALMNNYQHPSQRTGLVLSTKTVSTGVRTKFSTQCINKGRLDRFWIRFEKNRSSSEPKRWQQIYLPQKKLLKRSQPEQ